MSDRLVHPTEALVTRPYMMLRIGGVLFALHQAKPLMGCAHVVRHGEDACCCAEHPGAGVMCERCMARHVDRHPLEVEYRCDGCGVDAREDDLGMAGASFPLPLGLEVYDTRGHHRPLEVAWVVCMGECERCYADAEAMTAAQRAQVDYLGGRSDG